MTRYSDLNEVENLLASCQGYHDREENCGHSKDNAFNEELFVSPLEENCESLFEFSDRGRLKLLMEMNGLGIRLSY